MRFEDKEFTLLSEFFTFSIITLKFIGVCNVTSKPRRILFNYLQSSMSWSVFQT